MKRLEALKKKYKLEEHLIAKITGGKSYMAKNITALQDVLLEIERLERTEVKKSGRILG